MKLSVVIPMYNEEEIIESTIKTLDGALSAGFEQGEYEMIFVSDGSVDNTLGKAESLRGEIGSLRVIGYTPNRGKGCAVRTGMLEANGDFVLFTDCDLAYGAEIIKTFYDEFAGSDCDIVIGSRALKGGGYDGYTFLRKIMSKTYLWVISVFADFKLSDSQCGIKGFSNEAAKRIFGECESERFEFDLEALMIAQRLGCKITEIPVRIINHRESKVNPIRDSLRILKQLRIIKKREKQKKRATANQSDIK